MCRSLATCGGRRCGRLGQLELGRSRALNEVDVDVRTEDCGEDHHHDHTHHRTISLRRFFSAMRAHHGPPGPGDQPSPVRREGHTCDGVGSTSSLMQWSSSCTSGHPHSHGGYMVGGTANGAAARPVRPVASSSGSQRIPWQGCRAAADGRSRCRAVRVIVPGA